MQPPVDQPPAAPRPPQKAASMATYKRELRKAIAEEPGRAGDQLPEHHGDDGHDDHHPRLLAQEPEHSTASLPQSQDLQLPKSILTTEPESEPEGLAVIVSKSQIIVGETVVCPVPPDAAQYGIEAKYKRGSRNDYFIVPLGSALQAWRDSDKRIRMATGKDPTQSEAILIADAVDAVPPADRGDVHARADRVLEVSHDGPAGRQQAGHREQAAAP